MDVVQKVRAGPGEVFTLEGGLLKVLGAAGRRGGGAGSGGRDSLALRPEGLRMSCTNLYKSGVPSNGLGQWGVG
jgi:hypothetical protein